MWQMILVGTFTMVRHGQIGINQDQIKMTMAAGGNTTITYDGFKTEDACKLQMPKEGVSQFSINNVTIYIKSVECKEVPNTGEKSKS